ncbi:MAG: hypothetical protein JJ992_13460 [Planctomycetes bacterium]|nr:hypothetical protein [Planctomycetota bacterium]
MKSYCVRIAWFGLLLSASVPAVAQMQYPLDIAADEAGVLYVADRNLPGIWKIEKGELSPYFTGSKTFRTPLNAVRCVAIDRDGHLLAGDSSTREVYRFGEDDQPTALTGGGIGIPMGIAVNQAGDLLVSDLELHRIWKVPAKGGKPEVLAEVPAPRGVCLDQDGGLLVVSHGKDSQLVRVRADGKVDVVVQGRPFQFPHDVTVAADGTAYVSDGYAKAIWKVAKGAKPVQLVSGDPLVNPVGLTFRGADLLVVDPRADAVFQIDSSGKIAPVAIRPR